MDELLLWTIPFFCVSTYTSDWMFGEAACKLAYVFRESNKYTGILTLVALSVDRCLASYHNSAALRRAPVAAGVCAAVWVVSLAACLPYAINATVVRGVDRRRSCRLVRRLTTSDRRAWTYSQLVLGLLAPLAVIAGANALLLWRLRRRSARRRGGRGADGNRRSAAVGGGGPPSFGAVAMAKVSFS